MDDFQFFETACLRYNAQKPAPLIQPEFAASGSNGFAYYLKNASGQTLAKYRVKDLEADWLSRLGAVDEAAPASLDQLLPPPPPPPAPSRAPQLSDDQIEQLIARKAAELGVSTRARQDTSSPQPGGSLPVESRTLLSWIARLFFLGSGLVLIGNGIDGLSTRAASENSLIAVNINHRGGQSLGLGLAMLGVTLLPFPRGD